MLHNIRKLKSELLQEVESLMKNEKLSVLEATLHYCEENNVDLEQAAQIIKSNKKLTAKIETEAQDLNLIKRV